jgi:hypothetical protein
MTALELAVRRPAPDLATTLVPVQLMKLVLDPTKKRIAKANPWMDLVKVP